MTVTTFRNILVIIATLILLFTISVFFIPPAQAQSTDTTQPSHLCKLRGELAGKFMEIRQFGASYTQAYRFLNHISADADENSRFAFFDMLDDAYRFDVYTSETVKKQAIADFIDLQTWWCMHHQTKG